jgi:hypothetical protein
MTVHGSDKDNFIKIEPRGLEYPVYRVSASLRGHTVRNSGIVLVHPHKFLTALQEFERLRSGMVTLRGSEDFRLTIEPDGVRGHAWLSFFLAREIYQFSGQTGRSSSGRISIEGSFALSGDFISQFVRNFATLLAK